MFDSGFDLPAIFELVFPFLEVLIGDSEVNMEAREAKQEEKNRPGLRTDLIVVVNCSS